jgi:hypothetical protein
VLHKGKAMKLRLAAVIAVLYISCTTIPLHQQNADRNIVPQSSNTSQTGQERQIKNQRDGNNGNIAPYIGDGGKGITIVVPAPVFQNPSTSDTWIPQLFQDAITGDLVRYSAMTVIDRANEQLILAEQSISASGNYSDDDYVRMGNLTNAHYIVAGKIIKMAGSYSVSFRINQTETNEIKTAFDKTYPLRDIETGLASKEAVRELLAGMGIQLTETGEKSLLAIQETKTRASAQLAKGMAAEKNGDLVEALAHFTEAVEADSNMLEASIHIQNFSGAVPAGNIRERAEWELTQKQKWEKIFEDLKVYIREKLPIFIYDFSVVEDTFDSRSKKVAITVSPGVKVVPNRTVLSVYKTVLDTWFHIRGMEENKEWVKNVRFGGTLSTPPESYNLYFEYTAEIGLYDDYGDRIANFHWYGRAPSLYCRYLYEGRQDSSFQVVAQHKYFTDTKFVKITCKVPLDKITETITPQIESIYYSTDNARRRVTYSAFSVTEWQEWLASQRGGGN